MSKKQSQVIFDPTVSEFVTVAALYCDYIEQAAAKNRGEFVDMIIKLLPMLYVRALLLPTCETLGDEDLEISVTEEIYENIRYQLAQVMGEQDDYMDVFIEDMKYSDQPIARLISEDLADIYQDIKNFIMAFKQGLNVIMNDALAACQDNFKQYWGQKLVNTLRALHEVRFAQSETED